MAMSVAEKPVGRKRQLLARREAEPAPYERTEIQAQFNKIDSSLKLLGTHDVLLPARKCDSGVKAKDMDKGRNGQLDERLAKLMDSEWQTAAQVQRLSGGETLEIARSLDRLWEAGRIDRETQEIDIGARRKSGGARFHRIRYRRSALKP
jgi:hypothetical protein